MADGIHATTPTSTSRDAPDRIRNTFSAGGGLMAAAPEIWKAAMPVGLDPDRREMPAPGSGAVDGRRPSGGVGPVLRRRFPDEGRHRSGQQLHLGRELPRAAGRGAGLSSATLEGRARFSTPAAGRGTSPCRSPRRTRWSASTSPRRCWPSPGPRASPRSGPRPKPCRSRTAVFDVVLAASVIQLIPDGAALRPRAAARGQARRPGDHLHDQRRERRPRLSPGPRAEEIPAFPDLSLPRDRGPRPGRRRRRSAAIRFLYYPFGGAASIPGAKKPGLIPRIFGTTVVVEAVREP